MLLSVKLTRIPKPVKQFLLKSLALFLIWKALYLSVLLPGRILDRPLTNLIGNSTAATLNFFSRSNDYSTFPTIRPKVYPYIGETEEGMALNRGQERLLFVADVCNGLEILVLYAGLILCLPAPPYRKLTFILGGIILIEILNVIRCSGLVLVFLHHPEYLDFSHHYLFTFVIYAFIFWLWYLFSKEPGLSKKLQTNATAP